MKEAEILPGDLVSVHKSLLGLVEEVSLTRQPESELVCGAHPVSGGHRNAGMMRIEEVAIVISLSKVKPPPPRPSGLETPWIMIDVEVLTSNGELGWVPVELIEKA